MESKKSANSTLSFSGQLARIVAGVFLLGLLSACGGGKTGSNIAVLDLDKLAEDTGYVQEIRGKITEMQDDLKSKLSAMEEQLNTQIKNKREEIGKNPSDKQKEEMAKIMKHARIQMQQARAQINNAMKKQSMSLVTQLHDLVRPIAREIAHKRGMSIILLSNDSVLLDYSADSDITTEVTQEVMKRKALPAEKADKENKAPADSAPAEVKPAESSNAG